MEAFTVIDHIAPVGFPDHFFGALKLLKGGEGRLIHKIILARLHYPDAQRAALAGYVGGADHPGFPIFQDLIQTLSRLCLRIGLQKGFHFFRIGIIHIFDRPARFRQAVAHAIDVTVVNMGCGKNKFARPDNRLRFPLGCVIHAV